MKWYSAVCIQEPYTERNVFVIAWKSTACGSHAGQTLWGKAVNDNLRAVRRLGSGGHADSPKYTALRKQSQLHASFPNTLTFAK